MYDIKDENYSGYLEGLLLANLPIDFYGLKIKQLTVKEVLLMGEDKFSKLIKPFTINTKLIEQIKDTDLQTLDIIYGLEGEFLDNTKECLCLLFGVTTDEISILNNPRPELVIKNDKNFVFIDCNKFEELKDIILKMFNTRELNEDDIKRNEESNKLEKIMKIENRREREYQLAIYNNRQKTETKQIKQTKLYNVYNFISNCDGMDYKKPLDITIYQIFNSYNIKHVRDGYEYTMRLASSGMVSGDGMDLTPLSQRIIK